MAESIIDGTVSQMLNTGAAEAAIAASNSRTRAWDNLDRSVQAMWDVNLTSPSVLAAQGIRMLNGTPGAVPHPTTDAAK